MWWSTVSRREQGASGAAEVGRGQTTLWAVVRSLGSILEGVGTGGMTQSGQGPELVFGFLISSISSSPLPYPFCFLDPGFSPNHLRCTTVCHTSVPLHLLFPTLKLPSLPFTPCRTWAQPGAAATLTLTWSP